MLDRDWSLSGKNGRSGLVAIREKWSIGTGRYGVCGRNERKIVERDQSRTGIFTKATSRHQAFL